MTIWKFPFEVRDTITIDMPEGAKILDVQVQNGVACIWAIVSPSNPLVTRIFRIFGTGQEMQPCGPYLGTFQFPDFNLVFHMFHL